MAATAWNKVLGLAGRRKRRASWADALGEALPAFGGCLRKAGGRVSHARCAACGCAHEVLPAAAGEGFEAHCRCADRGCGPFRLGAEEAEAWTLDAAAVGGLLRRALGLEGAAEVTADGLAADLGACPAHPLRGRVWLLCAGDAAGRRRGLEAVAGRSGAGCVLAARAEPGLERLARAARLALVPLEGRFAADASGVSGTCGRACAACADLSNREAVEAVVERLEAPVRGLARERDAAWEEAGARKEELARVVTDPTGAAARIAAAFGNGASRDLFYLLIHTEERDGRKKTLSYNEIGMRMGGITKQAVEQKVRRFKREYREPWAFAESVRKPHKARRFSELGPAARRRRGIDESYGYGE